MSADAIPTPMGGGNVDGTETNVFDARARAYIEQSSGTATGTVISEPRPLRPVRPAPLIGLGGRRAPPSRTAGSDVVGLPRHEDVLMPSMPRTMSSGADLFRSASSTPSSVGGLTLLSSASALPTPPIPATQTHPGPAPLPMGSSSNDLNLLGMLRSTTPNIDGSIPGLTSVSNLGSLASTPVLEFAPPLPAMTPTLFMTDQMPTLAASVAPGTQSTPLAEGIDGLDAAAALLHHFRSGVRTPTPNSGAILKEENVFEKNLMILSTAPSFESADVAPKPRGSRRTTRTASNGVAAAAVASVAGLHGLPALEPSAKPSDLMMPDMVPRLTAAVVAAVPGLLGPNGVPSATGARGTKRRAAATAGARNRRDATPDEEEEEGQDDDNMTDDDVEGMDGNAPIPRKRKGQMEEDSVLARKRRRRREKCRVAATRFRQKKRDELREMEDIVAITMQSNSDLMSEITTLRKKIADTKVFLIQHEKCLGPQLPS